jgi:hypothetical protein
MIFEVLGAIKEMITYINTRIAARNRVQEVKKIESLKKETQENIEKEDIDKINENLKF